MKKSLSVCINKPDGYGATHLQVREPTKQYQHSENYCLCLLPCFLSFTLPSHWGQNESPIFISRWDGGEGRVSNWTPEGKSLRNIVVLTSPSMLALVKKVDSLQVAICYFRWDNHLYEALLFKQEFHTLLVKLDIFFRVSHILLLL